MFLFSATQKSSKSLKKNQSKYKNNHNQDYLKLRRKIFIKCLKIIIHQRKNKHIYSNNSKKKEQISLLNRESKSNKNTIHLLKNQPSKSNLSMRNPLFHNISTSPKVSLSSMKLTQSLSKASCSGSNLEQRSISFQDGSRSLEEHLDTIEIKFNLLRD